MQLKAGQVKPGRWQRTPPAIFPPIMGLFGLGLTWRMGAEAFGLPPGLAEVILGAVSLLFGFALAAWLAKPFRRPGVIVEELRVLPGRAGLAAMTLSLMLLAVTVAPYAPRLSLVVLIAAFVAHLLLALLMVRVLFSGPEEARIVTPVWHLSFVGFIIAPLAGVPLGLIGTAQVILYATIPVAVAIWAVSLWQLFNRIPPAPLRPLLAIHLAPASLFATVAALLGQMQIAGVFAALAAAIFLALLVAGRWIVQSGFSPLWGAFTFPLAAFASALFAVSGTSEALRITAGLVLVFATMVIVPIAFRVLQDWGKGGLAEKTNAAIA